MTMREDVIGRANVEDTPELDAYYAELGRQQGYALWTVANAIEPWHPQPSVAADAVALRGVAPAGAAGARPGQPREGRPARDRAGESRPQGALGLRRLALHRFAGHAAGRVRHRAQSCLGGAALRHGRRGRLYGGRRPQDGSRRRRLRHHAERSLARPWCRCRRRGDASGRTASTCCWSTSSTPTSTPCIPSCGRSSNFPLNDTVSVYGGPRPAAGGRRIVEQAVFAAAQIRMGPDLRDAGQGIAGERRIALRRHHHAIRQSGDRRAGDEDARRLHPVAACRASARAPTATPARSSTTSPRAPAIRSSPAGASTGAGTTSSWFPHGPGTSTPTHPIGRTRCCSRSTICRRCRRSVSIGRRPTARVRVTSRSCIDRDDHIGSCRMPY